MARSSLLAALLCALGPAATIAQTPAAGPAQPAAPAPVAAAPSTVPAAPAAAPGTSAGAEVTGTELEIRTLEARVEELKERVHRTKARLQGLEELAVGGDLSAGAKAVVVHRNEMGASYVLEAATFALDGAPVWARADAGGELDRRDVLPVFDGRIAPGNHRLTLRLTYRGKGEGAPRYQVESAYTFDAEPGKVTRVQIVGYERSASRPEERPAVRYELAAQPEDAARRPGDGGGAAK